MKNSLYISLIPIILLACQSTSKKSQTDSKTGVQHSVVLTEKQIQNAEIIFGKIESKNISSTIQLNGKISVPPQNKISISVPLGGFVESIKLITGKSVKKGEILVIMEDQQYIQLQQEYLTAKAQFLYDESEYLRQKELNKNKASSDKVFEQVKATYQTQLITIKSLEQKLQLIGIKPSSVTANTISKSIRIISPINGFVTAINVNPGKYVNPSEVLVELIDLSDKQLTLTAFEKDIQRLEIGQKVFVHSNNNPIQQYQCEIIAINHQISTQNAAEVQCKFLNQNNQLLPGMFMNAQIELKKAERKSLPDDAIVQFESKNYVFTETSRNRFAMQEIEVGEKENGYTEIVNSALFENRKIVIKGAYDLLMVLKNSGEEEGE